MSGERILIVRTSALGDVVHTMPLAAALRRARPRARIGWVVESRFAPLLENHPAVDELLKVSLKTWRREPFAARTWRELVAFLRQLSAFSPDVVLDTMGNHKGGILAALTLADRRIGAARPDRREPSSALWISQPVELEGEHVVERTLSLLSALDIDDREVDFAASTILPGLPAGSGTPPLLIHPGAGWRNKEYPPHRWGRVARELVAESGLAAGVLAGPGEEKLAAEVAQFARGRAAVVPAPSLASLAAHLRQARLMLAGDTGPLHLAIALGTPALCVLGPTDPARNGVWSAPEANVVHRLPCSFCYQRLDGPRACLLAIGPDEVVARARLLLEGAAG